MGPKTAFDVREKPPQPHRGPAPRPLYVPHARGGENQRGRGRDQRVCGLVDGPSLLCVCALHMKPFFLQSPSTSSVPAHSYPRDIKALWSQLRGMDYTWQVYEELSWAKAREKMEGGTVSARRKNCRLLLAGLARDHGQTQNGERWLRVLRARFARRRRKRRGRRWKAVKRANRSKRSRSQLLVLIVMLDAGRRSRCSVDPPPCPLARFDVCATAATKPIFPSRARHSRPLTAPHCLGLQ